MRVWAIVVVGKKVKVRKCSYNSYGYKSLRAQVLMRKQVCANEANDSSQSMCEIPILGFMSAENLGLFTRPRVVSTAIRLRSILKKQSDAYIDLHF